MAVPAIDAWKTGICSASFSSKTEKKFSDVLNGRRAYELVIRAYAPISDEFWNLQRDTIINFSTTLVGQLSIKKIRSKRIETKI